MSVFDNTIFKFFLYLYFDTFFQIGKLKIYLIDLERYFKSLFRTVKSFNGQTSLITIKLSYLRILWNEFLK